MGKVNLKINASVETRNGELKTGVVLAMTIFAKDLTQTTHDVVGYKGLAYTSEATATAGEEPIRLKKLHEAAIANPRGFRFDFEGQIMSPDLVEYDVETVDVGGGVKKAEPTAAAQSEIVTKIIAAYASILELQTSDFEILA